MKTKILKYTLLASILLPLGASAQRFHHRDARHKNVEDSVIIFEDPAKVVIIQDYKKRQKRLSRTGGIAIRLAENSKGSWSLMTGGLGFGLNGAINQPEGTGLQMGKSFEVLWLKALAAEYKWGRQAISFGIGFDWRNFKMTGDPYRMYKMHGGGISIDDYPAATIPLNSTLKIFSLDIPVLYSYELPKLDLKFSVGPILNFNTYSSLKTSYINPEGNKVTEFVKGVGQNLVTFELFGSVSWKCMGLYLKGQPVKALKSTTDINFNPLTVGVIFFM